MIGQGGWVIIFEQLRMRPSNQRMESSVHSQGVIEKMGSKVSIQDSQRSSQTQGIYSEIEQIQIKSKSRKSETLTEEKKIVSSHLIHTPISQHAQTYYHRQSHGGAGEYFEEPGMSASQHQYSIDRVNVHPSNVTQSKQTIENISRGSESVEGEMRRMKGIIMEKEKCIRDITERLRMIMEQLERYEIESKANQCFARLMNDLSRMFQIPDISIEDIRIQVSHLLEEKRSREHSTMINERRNVEEIQVLIDKLNNEVTMKNTLEIKLVDVQNQNLTFRSTIETLTTTVNQQSIEMREMHEEMLGIKEELEDSNRMRKSGSETMGNENRVLKMQSDKVGRERDQLEVELREVQARFLDIQGEIVECESRYNTEIRKKDFQEQQFKRELEICNASKEKLVRENQEIMRVVKEMEVERMEIQQINLGLKREIEMCVEERRLVEEQSSQTLRSKEEIKQELIGQQDKIREEYEQFLGSYRENLNLVEVKLREAVESEKSRNGEIGELRLLNERLQLEVSERMREIEELNSYKITLAQTKSNTDQKLNLTLRQIENIKHSKDLEINQKDREINQIKYSFQEIQRELKAKSSEIESMKRSYTSQSQSLDKFKKNLMTDYTKQHQIRMELEEELRLKQTLVLEYLNRIEILERQNTGNLASSSRLDSLARGEAEARREAEKMKEISEKSIQRERIEYEEKIAEEHLKAISLNREVDELQMTISKLEYKLTENEQMITFLKSELDAKDKSVREIRDSFNTGGREYQKLSLELSTSQKGLMISRETEHQKRIQEINSFVLELQNTLRSKQTIIERLNSQLESIGSNLGRNLGSQGSIGFSNLEENPGESMSEVRGEKREVEREYEQYQAVMREKEQSYKGLIARYQGEIDQLRKQIIYRQEEENVRGSRSSHNSQSRNMTVLQSQDIQVTQSEFIKAQELKYQQLQESSKKQISQLKLLNSDAMNLLDERYNESKEELLRQVKVLTEEVEVMRVSNLNEKIEAEKKIKLMLEQIEGRDRSMRESVEQPGASIDLGELTLLNNKLEVESSIRRELELEIKAYEQVVIQLRKQNQEQQQEFESLKEKNMETSIAKASEMNGLFQREKESLQMVVESKLLQIKALESQNSQLKMEISSLKQDQVHPRPRSMEYARQLDEKTQTLRELQMENSTLTIAMDDLRKELTQREERIYEISRSYKDEKFCLEKENIELISRIKVLEIKVDELTFQLKSLREIKSNTLLSGRIIASLDLENRLATDHVHLGVNAPSLTSVNNSIQIPHVDLHQDKHFHIPHTPPFIPTPTLNQKSFAFPQQVIQSSLGATKPLISDLIQTKQKITYSNGLNSINNSQFTFNLAHSSSQNQKNLEGTRLLVGGITPSPFNPSQQSSRIHSLNNINTLNAIANNQKSSRNSSREHIGRETQEQTRPYFSKKPELGISIPANDLRPFFSPGKHYQSSQYSPRTYIEAAKSLDKDPKPYNYSKVYQQSIRTKQRPALPQIYDKNKYFANTQISTKQIKTVAETPINQPYSFNTLSLGSVKSTGKVNLKQFSSLDKPSEYFLNSNSAGEKSQQIGSGKQVTVTTLPNYEKGIHMYQNESSGKQDPCC